MRWDAQDGGCWWFSSSGDGRFDLDDPLGTCYLGETEGVAARKRCGRLMAMRLPITEAIYHERVVSEVLSPSADISMADLADPAASTAGVTGELFASADYAQGKTWAHACWDAGFGGLRYPPRFTPGGSERARAAQDTSVTPLTPPAVARCTLASVTYGRGPARRAACHRRAADPGPPGRVERR